VSGRRILIVDDEPDVRLSLQLALEVAGYKVAIAANGHEALDQQRREPADILITDIFMPESDGIETIAGFRKEFPQTRIVVVSGASRRPRGDYLEAARMVGADLTLKKPIDIDKLIGQLRALAPG
jgi:CheY-like chemotaxis protein